MIAVLPVIDPARCVTDPARFCRLAELRRLESSDDCLDKWRPSPRPWWKRPRASTSWSDLRCKDEVILVCMPLLLVLLPPAPPPAAPPAPVLPMFGIPWWSICKKCERKLEILGQSGQEKFRFSEMVTKIWKNLPYVLKLLSKRQNMWDIFSNFLVFSQCLNFIKVIHWFLYLLDLRTKSLLDLNY